LYIEENDILEYRDLLDNLRKAEKIDMWDIAASHTIFVNAYIKSRRHKFEEAERKNK
jgi:hypothetical protein